MAKKIVKLNFGNVIKTINNKKLRKLSALLNLVAPRIEITDNILNVYDDEGLATSYNILVDGVVKATLTRLARPEIEIEEAYIKGAAIENAKSYKLLKVADDQYTDIGEQVIGKQNEGFTKGYVDSTGAFISDETIGWRYTDFIHIDKLADVDGACVMLTPDSDNTGRYVANFYTDNDVGSFVGGLTYNDMNSSGFAAEDVVYYAQSKNAKYVVFSSRWQSAESLWVNLTDSIFFNLDEYADVLTAGENHTLVVKACGDGTNYIDSNYSNEILYVVEEPIVEDELQGTWVLNDEPSSMPQESFIFNFNSNGDNYTSIRQEVTITAFYAFYYDNTYVFLYDDGYKADGTHWENNAYKTINITSKLSEVENGEALLTWLKANATKQSATTPTLISFTIEGTTYQAEEGMTWAEWVNSEYNTGGYTNNGSGITTGDMGYVNITETVVPPTDAIIENYSYSYGVVPV